MFNFYFSCFMFYFCIIMRPFNSMLRSLVEPLNEFVALLVTFLYMTMLDIETFDDYLVRQKTGWALLLTFTVLVLFNALISFTHKVYSIFKLIKGSKKKSSKVVPIVILKAEQSLMTEDNLSRPTLMIEEFERAQPGFKHYPCSATDTLHKLAPPYKIKGKGYGSYTQGHKVAMPIVSGPIAE